MKKKFESGDKVEVQREVDAAWEPATYDKPRFGQERTGWHIVKLSTPRRVIVIGREIEVDWVAVPANRIRIMRT